MSSKIAFRNRLLAIAAFGSLFPVSTMGMSAMAASLSSIDDLAGTWSGTGSMKPSDAPREKVRCKVAYVVKKPGKSLSLDLKCASDAYKMLLTANIEQDGSTLSGNWFESQYRQGGKISGKSSNGLIEARVEGDTVTALVTIQTKDNRQSFVMDAPGAWVSQVSLELKRDPH